MANQERQPRMFGIVLIGGIGGLLPTLVKLGTVYTQAPNTPPPAPGLYIGLAIFFGLGALFAGISKEGNLMKVIAIGIAAPGVVTNFLAGSTQALNSATPQITAQVSDEADANAMVAGLLGASPAHAQVVPSKAMSRTLPMRQLNVTPRLTGNQSQYAVKPVTLQFLAYDGSVLTTTNVDPRLTTTVAVPQGAQVVRAITDGKSTDTALPKSAYSMVDLTLSVRISQGSDLVWALGGSRQSKVDSVAASIGSVRTQ